MIPNEICQNNIVMTYLTAICFLFLIFVVIYYFSDTFILLTGKIIYFLSGRLPNRALPDISKAKSIVIIRLDDLGDVLLSTAFIREIKKNAPNTSIAMVVKSQLSNLFDSCPYIDNVYTFNNKAGGFFAKFRIHKRAIMLAYKHLWFRKYDIAIQPRWDEDIYYSSIVTFYSGATYRIGYSEHVNGKKQSTNMSFDNYFTHTLSDATVKHEAERNLDLIRFAGGKITESNLEYWVCDTDRSHIDQLLSYYSAQSRFKNIVFCLGSGSPSRCWPLENFTALAKIILEKLDIHVFIIGNTEEKHLGEKLVTAVGHRVVNFAGLLTLPQTAALMERCSLYVGNDTGPMHLAAALRVPVVEISKHPLSGDRNHPNSPTRFGPWNVPHVIVQPAQPTFPCTDCCGYTQEPHCILTVSAEAVEKAIYKLLHAESKTAKLS